MAINTSTITQLISDFRALSQKDSISPESLGVLLQRLADLINSAASDADYKAIYDAFQKFVANIAAVPTALYKLEQGSADRNDILMNITTSHLINGITMTLKDAVFIRQATTERAGAMRAQQVADLNSTRTGLASLQKSHTELASKVSTLETTVSSNGELLNRVADEANYCSEGIADLTENLQVTNDDLTATKNDVSAISDRVSTLETTVSKNGELMQSIDEVANYCSEGIADLTENLQVTNDDLAATQKSVEENARGITSIKAKTDCPRIAAEVIDGKLHIVNCDYYREKGYAAFVFRFTSKRNRFNFDDIPDKTRGAKHKGWHVIGGLPDNVKFDYYGYAMFSTSLLEDWHYLKNDVISHSYEPDYISGVKGTGEKRYVSWGKKTVKLATSRGSYMMRRFRFAIGFGNPYNRNIYTISPANLVSNLAEFSVIFDPRTDKFHFGK